MEHPETNLLPREGRCARHKSLLANDTASIMHYELCIMHYALPFICFFRMLEFVLLLEDLHIEVETVGGVAHLD